MDGTQGEGDGTGRPQNWTEVFRERSEEGGITQDREISTAPQHRVPSVPTSREGRRGSLHSPGEPVLLC